MQTGGYVCFQREKFVKVKLVKSWYADNIRCCCDVVRVCDSSIWAPSRRSVLPHRLRCHNKITGGLLDSSFPQGFLLTSFFFFSKFGAKHVLLCHKVWRGKLGESEEWKVMKNKMFFPTVLRYKTICKTMKVPLEIYSLARMTSMGEGLTFHFGKQKH